MREKIIKPENFMLGHQANYPSRYVQVMDKDVLHIISLSIRNIKVSRTLTLELMEATKDINSITNKLKRLVQQGKDLSYLEEFVTAIRCNIDEYYAITYRLLSYNDIALAIFYAKKCKEKLYQFSYIVAKIIPVSEQISILPTKKETQ